MTRVLIILALLFSVNALLIAQSPRNILLKSDPNAESVLSCVPGQENFAGTVSLGPFTGQSNDINLDTMYLCFGDQVLIDHDAGSENLIGDPIPATPAGVGYAFYDCPPTISGDELANITTDPCLSTNPPPTNGIYISTGGTTSGDVLFENTGFLQDFFNAGAPLMLHFAPITYDNLVDSIAIFEGNPAGPCVNVNTNEAFAVVYLNEIEFSNINTAVGGNGCTGSFDITGGLPEFNGSNYDVEMTLSSDPSVEAFKQGITPSHGGTQNFKVFTPGLYDVVVTDDKGCQSTFQINMGGCETVSMVISEEFGENGDNVCVSITASDFVDIQSFQFSINFDNTILSYTGDSNQSNALTESGVSPVTFGPADPNLNGQITCNWLDLNFDGQTLPDGTVLFELCFDILGNIGDVADISFDYSLSSPTPIEIKRVLAPFTFEDMGLDGGDGSITIIDLQNINVALDTQNVNCNGGMDGAFTLTVSGGNAPYTFVYAQSGGGGLMGPDTIFTDGGSFTVSDLDAGLYIITTADQSVPPAISTDSVLITEPPIPLGVGPDIFGGFTEPLCFADSTGAFPVNVSGGTPPYDFLWNTGDTVEDLVGIPAGFYQITVTDDNGCTAIAGATLSNPAQLVTTTGGVDASCSGADDGSVFVTAIGGTLNTTNYSYLWNTSPPSAADTVNNQDVGQYFVTVTDDNGCSVTDSVTIGAATIILANAVISEISCFDADNGSIDLNPSAIGIDNGGYTFNWNPLIAGPSDDQVDNLGPGNYAFTITDAVGCNIDSVVTLIEPSELEVTLVGIDNEGCGAGNDGAISVIATGGILALGSDYTYDWGAQQGSMITGLSAGDYTVTVTDDNGCIDSLLATVLPPDAPTIDGFDITDVPCATSTNGAITVNTTPGSSPIVTIEWSNGDSGSTITDLAPGLYIVTVTAQDGCDAVDTALVDAPLPLIAADTLLTAPLCNGQCNGAISVAIQGGTQPYTYSWSSGQNTNPVFGLCAGTYTLTVNDANFCPPLVLELELVDPAPLVAQVDPTSISAVSCFEGIPCDGEASATATGGGAATGDYVFTWSSGTVEAGTSSTVNNLCQDDQTVIVSDANGCIDTASFVVPSPTPVELDFDNSIIESVSCNGDTDGSATAVGTGGTPDPVNGYTFFWPFNNSTNATISNLSPGTYQVQITDGNGCVGLADVEIGEPDALLASLDSLSNVTCFEGMDGAIRVFKEGGNPGPATFEWSDNIGAGPLVGGLSAGAYTVTVTDVEGCTGTATFLISEPPPLSISFDSLPGVRCFGENVQLSIDTVVGGNGGPYDVFGKNRIKGYVVYPAEGKLLGGVPGGPSTVIVRDNRGCELETDIFIDEPPPVEVAIEADGFFGQDEVEIDLGDSLELDLNLVQVFLPVDSVIWAPMNDIRSFPNGDPFTILVKPLETTVFSVVVIDEDGCVGTDDIEIVIDKNRNVYVPNIFSPNDDGRNDFFEIAIGPGVEIVNYMQVYDRWGELLFEAEDFLPELNNSVKWDGTFGGKRMNPGAYVYLIEVQFVDGTVLLYRGTVSLVR